ncbi:MAG: TM2 domain-containing protein [Lachnospiraceae bacterium]|nr:TM2 domain-containing protein [Lachnospiraceae bacterium]
MYFCKNCGSPYQTDQAVVCVKCGAPKGQGVNYCHNCGRPVQPGAVVCMNCGVALGVVPGVNAKSKLAAGLFGIFLGQFGVHNFYLGYTTKAIIQLVMVIVGWLTTCLGLGVFLIFGAAIWGLVEGIMILTGSINTDAQGNPLRD